MVAAIDPETALVARLGERGITQAVARKLVQALPSPTVGGQLAVFDWLREVDLEDERYSAGRLRWMIEEDWKPRPGFESAAAREEREEPTAKAARRAGGTGALGRRARGAPQA